MKIKVEVELPVEKKGTNLLVSRATALAQILGTTSVVGNLHYYKIKKVGNEFIVPISLLPKRIAKLKKDRISIEEKLDLVTKIYEAVK